MIPDLYFCILKYRSFNTVNNRLERWADFRLEKTLDLGTLLSVFGSHHQYSVFWSPKAMQNILPTWLLLLE